LLGHTAGGRLTAFTDAFALEAPSRSAFQLESASAAHFHPLLHDTFTVRSAEGARLPLVLARVTERPTVAGVEQFSLEFHASPGTSLLHGTHAFRHRRLGAFDLFITPVGAATSQLMTYEACFSRRLIAAGDGANG
jgi:hypothetical protein